MTLRAPSEITAEGRYFASYYKYVFLLLCHLPCYECKNAHAQLKIT